MEDFEVYMYIFKDFKLQTLKQIWCEIKPTKNQTKTSLFSVLKEGGCPKDRSKDTTLLCY